MFSPTLASNFTRYRLVASFMALALFSTTEMSYASSISFQGSSGTWINTNPVSYALNTQISGEGTSNLNWGNPWADGRVASTAYTIDSANPQKNVTFSSTAVVVSDVLSQTAFTVGSFSHRNSAIFGQSEITDTTLSLKLSLGGTYKTFDYKLTSYVDPDTYTDELIFSNMTDSTSRIQQFTLGNQSYSFNLLGFNDAQGYHPGVSVDDGVTTPSIALWASITAVPTPVPVPAALWLFGSGLLGLAGFAKRKRTPQ